MPHHIYHLIDENDVPHYVGKTANTRRRLYGHMHASKKPRLPVHRWIKELREQGKKPRIKSVRTCEAADFEAEHEEIRRCLALGNPLKNVNTFDGVARFVRLTQELDAAVEVHRINMERESGLPVDASDALRDLVARGAKASGLLKEE